MTSDTTERYVWPGKTHGKPWVYTTKGCRCALCTNAIVRRNKEYHLYKDQRRPVENWRATRRIQALYWLGHSSTAQGRIVGWSRSRVEMFLNDPAEKCFHKSWVKVEQIWEALKDKEAEYTTAAVLAHNRAVKYGWVPPQAWSDIDDPDEFPDPDLWTHDTVNIARGQSIQESRKRVPMYRVQRRLWSLAWMGWSTTDIAKKMDVGAEYVWKLMTKDRHSFVMEGTFRRVDAAFEALCMHHAPASGRATRAHNQAVRGGWGSPMAWVDIDDPKEKRKGSKGALPKGQRPSDLKNTAA